MVTNVAREKCLRDLGDVTKSVGWALSLIALNEIGLAEQGNPPEGFDLIGEALEEIERAVEGLQLVQAYLKCVAKGKGPQLATTTQASVS